METLHPQDATPEHAYDQDFLGPGSLNPEGNKNHDCNESTVGKDIGDGKICPERNLVQELAASKLVFAAMRTRMYSTYSVDARIVNVVPWAWQVALEQDCNHGRDCPQDDASLHT
jgi:hypothetical protein